MVTKWWQVNKIIMQSLNVYYVYWVMSNRIMTVGLYTWNGVWGYRGVVHMERCACGDTVGLYTGDGVGGYRGVNPGDGVRGYRGVMQGNICGLDPWGFLGISAGLTHGASMEYLRA